MALLKNKNDGGGKRQHKIEVRGGVEMWGEVARLTGRGGTGRSPRIRKKTFHSLSQSRQTIPRTYTEKKKPKNLKKEKSLLKRPVNLG